MSDYAHMTYVAQAMIRDDGRCFRCGDPVFGRPSDCHHRLFAKHGGPDTLDNRITLCGFGNNLRGPDGQTWCHGWVHHNYGEAQDNGWVISQFDKRTPAQIPAVHHAYGPVYLTPGGELIEERLVVAWTIGGRIPLTEGDVERVFGPVGGGHG